MARVLIGIIAYIPNDEKLRKIRIDCHTKQLNWIKTEFCSNVEYDIMGVYQNYTEQEIPQGVDIVRLHTEGIGAPRARNEILDEFYKDDKYDICVVLDDDRLLYNYYDMPQFLPDLLKLKDKRINCIMPLDPRFSPFKQNNYKYENVINENWILKKTTTSASGVFILHKNIKPYKIYFEDLRSNLGQGYDDGDFLFKMLDKNIPPYRCYQLVIKTLGGDDSVLFDDFEKRLSLHESNLKVLYERWKHLGIEMTYSKEGKFRGFTQPKIDNDFPKYILLPRANKYIFTDNLIYRKKPTKQVDTLFD